MGKPRRSDCDSGSGKSLSLGHSRYQLRSSVRLDSHSFRQRMARTGLTESLPAEMFVKILPMPREEMEGPRRVAKRRRVINSSTSSSEPEEKAPLPTTATSPSSCPAPGVVTHNLQRKVKALIDHDTELKVRAFVDDMVEADERSHKKVPNWLKVFCDEISINGSSDKEYIQPNVMATWMAQMPDLFDFKTIEVIIRHCTKNRFRYAKASAGSKKGAGKGKDTSEDTSVESAEEKELDESMEENESQESMEQNESQKSLEQNESQKSLEQNESQEFLEENESQEFLEENESQEFLEENEAQEFQEENESQEFQEENESQEFQEENDTKVQLSDAGIEQPNEDRDPYSPGSSHRPHPIPCHLKEYGRKMDAFEKRPNETAEDRIDVSHNVLKQFIPYDSDDE